MTSPGAVEAEFWCDTLWGSRAGYAIAAVGRDPYLRGEKYTHTGLDHVAVEWPKEKRRLLDVVLPQAERHDIYVAPLLRDAPNRRKADSRPLQGQHAWLDADEWDLDRQKVLDRLAAPVLAVRSGGAAGRRHLYCDLGQLYPGAVVALTAKALARDCRADTYGGAEKLLRLPGTYNHKQRVQGGQPVRVSLCC